MAKGRSEESCEPGGFFGKWWRTIILVILLLIPVLFWMAYLDHVSINEVGVAYNSWDGSITVQDKPGWYVTNPFTFVTTFSTLPMKVTIPSEAAVINTKIVRFKKEGVEEYIRMQGFHWLMSNSSLQNIMMGYAFSGKDYPFMEILQEAGPEEVGNLKNKSVDWKKASDRAPDENQPPTAPKK